MTTFLRANTALLLWVVLISVSAAEEQNPAAAPGAAATDTQLAEIVVTAQKREQRLNDVGAAVTALSGDALSEAHIVSQEDFAQAVPGLSYTNSQNGTPVYTLRGIGFYETSLAAYPTVTVYTDEAPLPFPALTRHAAFDLQRVEVLKGPQGILFGQNATGGAINMIAAKPSDRFGAGVDVSYGSFNQVIGEGYVTGPLSQTLSTRAAFRSEHADGWQRSNSRPGDRNGSLDNNIARVQLDFHPSDTVRLRLGANGWIDHSQTQAPQFVGIQVQQPGFLSPKIDPSEFSPLTPRAADWTPGLPFADNKFYQLALRGDFDLTSTLTLTSLSSYLHYTQRQRDDLDGLTAVSLDLTRDDGVISSVMQELRIANSGHGRIQWVLGGNYEQSKVDQTILLAYPDSSATRFFSTFGYPMQGTLYTAQQHMHNEAIFGNVEFQATERITLKSGLRFSQADRSLYQCNTDGGPPPYDYGRFTYNFVLGGRAGPFVEGDCNAINTFPSTYGGVPSGMPGPFRDTLNEHNVSWREGIDFRPAEGLLVYANIVKGYKAGSFPAVAASTFRQYLPVTQESVLSYEAGFKSTLFEHRVQLNGTAFYYDYTDKQLRSKVLDPVYGQLDVLQNIPKSSVKGVEIELNTSPLRGLNVSAALVYTNATIDRFVGINAAGVSADFSGTPIPFTPREQGGLNIDYEFPGLGGWMAFVGSGINYRSSTFAVVGGERSPASAISNVGTLYRIAGYTLVDLRLGLRSSDARWRATLWGKNITERYYWNNVSLAYDTIGRYAGMPATYGVSLDYRF